MPYCSDFASPLICPPPPPPLSSSSSSSSVNCYKSIKVNIRNSLGLFIVVFPYASVIAVVVYSL